MSVSQALLAAEQGQEPGRADHECATHSVAISRNSSGKERDITSIVALLERVGLTVISAVEGYVQCPGEHLHTTATNGSDCQVWTNAETSRIPQIHCFHSSCGELCAQANRELWREAKGWRRHRSMKRPMSAFQRHDKEADDNNIAQILKDFVWPVAEILSSEGNEIKDVPEHDHWKFLLAMFAEEDTVWVGRDVRDTGSPNHQYRFKTAEEWLAINRAPGWFTCPCAFKPGSFSRSDKNVLVPRYVVIESDKLTHDQIGAVFRWLIHSGHGLTLKAVVDTGGKSLHGWFDYPSPQTVEWLREILPRLQCDKSMLTLSQPCRLPGVVRPETGRYQRLLYASLVGHG